MAKTDDFDIRRKDRGNDEADLDITPMIDITFLLLAFFVMVSKLDPQVPIPLPQAQFGTTVPDKNCVVLIVVPGDTDEEFKIFKGPAMEDAMMVTPGEETAMEEEIGNFVEAQFSQSPKLEAVLIKGAGEVRTRAIEVAKRGAGRSGLARDRKLFVGVEEN